MKAQSLTIPSEDLRFVNSMPEYDLATLDQSGPVDVSFPNHVNGFASWVVQGFQELSLAGYAVARAGNWYLDRLAVYDEHN
jgi:hypothetical protein